MSEHEWRPSPSPVEDWGEDDLEWEVDRIVGESIDAFSEKRYEIRWKDWKRADGTNTTWDKHDTYDIPDSVKKWEDEQAAQRQAVADAGPAVAIGIEPWQMWHEDQTIERARGYEELKKKYLPNGMDPRQPVDLDAICKRLRRPPSEENQRPGAGAPSEDAGRAHAAASSSSSRSPSAGSSVPEQAGRSQRQVRPLPRRAGASSTRPVEVVIEAVSRTRPQREHKRRKSLEAKWAAELQGAAPVTFVNGCDYEETPQLVDGFRYLERSYARAPNLPSKDGTSQYIVSCHSCKDRCTDASMCECQRPSDLELTDGSGKKSFAYTRKRLFNFLLPPGMEVIECNESCSCGEGCPNRVAQRPRDVPIEIFKTKTCGWGARATVDVPRGKVLGIYTGLLIRREEADEYGGERKSYIFDLDVREDLTDDETMEEKYSVDGYAHGNWTRFVNHSCDPNLRVVPVIWDTIPEINQPYLAFVANRDTEARTELTIDYNPKEAREPRSGKSRHQRPEDGKECVCGTAKCRGWVRV